MAYTLQAFLAQPGGLPSTLPAGLRVVVLPSGLEMVPLDTASRARLQLPLLPLTDDGSAVVPEALAKTGLSLSRRSKLIYVEAEFIGGEGAQAAALFDQGTAVRAAVTAPDAINAALRWLGFQAGERGDEFEAAGLGAKRDMDAW
jgi:hypothetical protein